MPCFHMAKTTGPTTNGNDNTSAQLITCQPPSSRANRPPSAVTERAGYDGAQQRRVGRAHTAGPLAEHTYATTIALPEPTRDPKSPRRTIARLQRRENRRGHGKNSQHHGAVRRRHAPASPKRSARKIRMTMPAPRRRVANPFPMQSRRQRLTRGRKERIAAMHAGNHGAAQPDDRRDRNEEATASRVAGSVKLKQRMPRKPRPNPSNDDGARCGEDTVVGMSSVC